MKTIFEVGCYTPQGVYYPIVLFDNQQVADDFRESMKIPRTKHYNPYYQLLEVRVIFSSVEEFKEFETAQDRVEVLKNLKEEEARAFALEKLTPDERRLLCL